VDILTLGRIICSVSAAEILGTYTEHFDRLAADQVALDQLGDVGFGDPHRTSGIWRTRTTVGHHQLPASPGAPIGQHGTDPAQPGLVQAAPERSPAHRGDVEVFDDDGALAAGQAGGKGVDGLAAQVDRPPVQGRQLGVRLAVPPGADGPAR
jgi:hypothetical protein